MILSVSRRTDIPAFYTEWFFNRIQEGYVDVRNPMNIHQVSRVPLSPEVVDCIVFWSKNPRPMLSRLDELKDYMYYFQYTINAYDKRIETGVPRKYGVINTFKRLSDIIGPKRVIWRYDPILLAESLNVEYHLKYFEEIAKRLRGYTNTCVISFVDLYKKTKSNLKDTEAREPSKEEMVQLAAKISQAARQYGMTIQTCAESIELASVGIKHGSCVDKSLIEDLLDTKVIVDKDQNQREECGCVQSIDIGEYNTCTHGCKYCYANFNECIVSRNRAAHDPHSSLLVGHVGVDDKVRERKVSSLVKAPEKFRRGDIVKLKHPEKYRKADDIYGYQINLYKIASINKDDVKLDSVSAGVPIEELLPVAVDGVEDRWIYYDPVVAASSLFDGDDIEGKCREYTYYMNIFEQEYINRKSYKEIVIKKHLLYVHEIQHWLRREVHPIDGLKVNEFKS